MLAGGNGIPPDPHAYQLEPKLDGQRVVAMVEPSAVTLTNRRGGDITGTYPELAALPAALAPHAAVLDGEVVAFDDKGHTSFQRLQRRMHVAHPPPRLLSETPVVFVVFDVLWLDGHLLVDRPQGERRRVLEGLAIDGPAWQTAPVLDATPEEALEACRHLGLEGFMAKRLNAPYMPGMRSAAWWKLKCGRRREFVVGGWSAGRGSRRESIGSLALGCYDVTAEEAERRGRPQRLFYVGQAGSGLTEEMIGQLRRLFERISTPASPFVNAPPVRLSYVRPMLVVEVAYSEVTESGTIRQPALKGLRTDVVAGEVSWDDEIAARFAGPAPSRRPGVG
ncbi:MAG: DNA ligase [Actinomycetota bacterium]|nr:DNA ligase [Actinomycetota bacterium]